MTTGSLEAEVVVEELTLEVVPSSDVVLDVVVVEVLLSSTELEASLDVLVMLIVLVSEVAEVELEVRLVVWDVEDEVLEIMVIVVLEVRVVVVVLRLVEIGVLGATGSLGGISTSVPLPGTREVIEVVLEVDLVVLRLPPIPSFVSAVLELANGKVKLVKDLEDDDVVLLVARGPPTIAPLL